MKAKNDFGKDFFKLMNNSVLGKTMENIGKHKDINLATNEEAYLKRVMKPNFKSGIRFSENLMGCEIRKIRVLMNKPIYLGQAILDLSKIAMYEFHYDYMLLKYASIHGDNIWLCYMDIDITMNDFYEDIASNVEARFDTSGYSQNHSPPTGVNKKVIGLMKDKLGGRIMTELMALRQKLYAYRTLSGSGKRKCKRVKKCIVIKC